jgi:hypothetical protein
MKTKLLKKNVIVQGVATLAMVLLGSNVQSQQFIGQFPHMDGGIETQTPTTIASSTRTATTWSISGTANAAVRSIISGPGARTGDKYLEMQMSTTVNNCRFNSPTAANGSGLLAGTQYTVQFFYKAATSLDPELSGSIYINGTATGSGVNQATTSTFDVDKWVKAYGTLTSSTTTGSLENFGAIRVATSTAAPYGSTAGYALADYDDFVVYAGAYDDVKPNPATAPTYSKSGNNATIGWTASTDIDGGGYVVVRYPSSATVYSDNDPNQNGIYSLNNTINSGFIARTGTVVYIGTELTKTITDPDAALYYYKIYAVDKAFNYANEITAKDASLPEPTLGVAKNDIQGLNVYPNPVKDGKLFINSDSTAVKTVAIYDILGKQVLSKEVASGQVDVSSLNKGIYVLKITEAGKTSTRKIVID